jgi:hypothetical protein
MIKLNKTISIKCINQWNLFCYEIHCSLLSHYWLINQELKKWFDCNTKMTLLIIADEKNKIFQKKINSTSSREKVVKNLAAFN